MLTVDRLELSRRAVALRDLAPLPLEPTPFLASPQLAVGRSLALRFPLPSSRSILGSSVLTDSRFA